MEYTITNVKNSLVGLIAVLKLFLKRVSRLKHKDKEIEVFGGIKRHEKCSEKI